MSLETYLSVLQSPFRRNSEGETEGVLVRTDRFFKEYKIYKTTNRRHVFWPYLRYSNIMAYKYDSKPSQDQQVFRRVSPSFETEVAQPKKSKSIGNRARESASVEGRQQVVIESDCAIVATAIF